LFYTKKVNQSSFYRLKQKTGITSDIYKACVALCSICW